MSLTTGTTEFMQSLLHSLHGVFTRPFDQKTDEALKGAAAAIGVAGTLVAIGEGRLGGLDAIITAGTDTAGPSLALVAIWMFVAAVLAKGEKQAIARAVSVISFWIAGTAVLILVAEQMVYTDINYYEPQRRFVFLGLFFLVPIHMFRIGLSKPKALFMTIALWVSTAFLTINLVQPPDVGESSSGPDAVPGAVEDGR